MSRGASGTNGLRLLVFGGRHFGEIRADYEALFAALDAVRAKRGVAVLIEGEACGADRAARAWAESRGVPFLPFPVPGPDWVRLGKAAGPLRNQRMIDEGRPTAAVGFPGGPGTADMRGRVLAAGIPLWEPLSGPTVTPDPGGGYSETWDV